MESWTCMGPLSSITLGAMLQAMPNHAFNRQSGVVEGYAHGLRPLPFWLKALLGRYGCAALAFLLCASKPLLCHLRQLGPKGSGSKEWSGTASSL